MSIGERLDTGGLFERSEALSALTMLLERLKDGSGGSLFLVAEAGLGKTTLLRLTESEARSTTGSLLGRCAVGRADGMLFGTGGAFRFADQLFGSLGVDVHHGAADPDGDVSRSNRFLSALRALDDASRASTGDRSPRRPSLVGRRLPGARGVCLPPDLPETRSGARHLATMAARRLGDQRGDSRSTDARTSRSLDR